MGTAVPDAALTHMIAASAPHQDFWSNRDVLCVWFNSMPFQPAMGSTYTPTAQVLKSVASCAVWDGFAHPAVWQPVPATWAGLCMHVCMPGCVPRYATLPMLCYTMLCYAVLFCAMLCYFKAAQTSYVAHSQASLQHVNSQLI